MPRPSYKALIIEWINVQPNHPGFTIPVTTSMTVPQLLDKVRELGGDPVTLWPNCPDIRRHNEGQARVTFPPGSNTHSPAGRVTAADLKNWLSARHLSTTGRVILNGGDPAALGGAGAPPQPSSASRGARVEVSSGKSKKVWAHVPLPDYKVVSKADFTTKHLGDYRTLAWGIYKTVEKDLAILHRLHPSQDEMVLLIASFVGSLASLVVKKTNTYLLAHNMTPMDGRELSQFLGILFRSNLMTMSLSEKLDMLVDGDPNAMFKERFKELVQVMTCVTPSDEAGSGAWKDPLGAQNEFTECERVINTWLIP